MRILVVEDDSVLRDGLTRSLRNAGYAFKPEWFAPHFEFRFPLIGTVTAAGITVELRHALLLPHAHVLVGEAGDLR